MEGPEYTSCIRLVFPCHDATNRCADPILGQSGIEINVRMEVVYKLAFWNKRQYLSIVDSQSLVEMSGSTGTMHDLPLLPIPE